MRGLSFKGVAGKRVLIEGDVQTGKTKLLEGLMKEALTCQVRAVSLIDMAPERIGKGGLEAGGKVAAKELRGLRYYRPDVVFAPRLQGGSREEVLAMAEENARRVGVILDLYLEEPTPILFMNDLTIYLHAGDEKRLERAISSAETFVGTAYAGVAIADDSGSGITRRERALLKDVEGYMDRVIIMRGSRPRQPQ